MNVLNLTLNTSLFPCPHVFIDGKAVKLKKSGNSYSCYYQTANPTAEISLTRIFEVSSPFWMITSLLFFFISCFGIFDARYDKYCRSVKYRLSVQLNQTSNIQMKFGIFKAGERAVELTGDCPVSEIENQYFIDETAKKRAKIMRVIKALLWVALIIAAIAVTILSIIF